MQMQLEKMLRVRDAADMLAVRETTVRKWMLLRKIAYCKLNGGAVRIAQSEVERLLADGHVPAREARR